MPEVRNATDEEWRSVVRGPRGIARFNDKGERTIERVEGGGTFFITPDERRRNQKICRDSRNDSFTNGAFVMMGAVEEDANSMSMMEERSTVLEDDELLVMLDSRQANFIKAVAEINDAITIQRLYELARKEKVGDAKVKAVAKRVKEICPDAVVIGDNLGVGKEDPDDGNDETKGIDRDIEIASKPREYAGVET